MPKRNPLFPIGATLHPLDDESLTPDRWYDRDLAEEIELLANAGCTLVRVLVGWRAFEPQVGLYDEKLLARLADIVDAIRKTSMRSIVCFLADDRHADLAQVSWGQKRDPRTDAYLVQREAELVSLVVSRLSSVQGVFAWQLGDEAFLSGFTAAEDLKVWASALTEAVREHDPKRPVIIGADAETLFRSSGFDAREILHTGEVLVAHATESYRAYIADGPIARGAATYTEPFLLQLAAGERRVMLDDVGPAGHQNSLAEEAAALRVSVWSALANRASGAVIRRVRDFMSDSREPYYVDPFESLVGIADADGTPKPACDALSSAIHSIACIDLDTLALVPERVAVVLPAERFEPLPSLGGLFDPRSALQAFVAAKQAHLPVTVVRESDGLSAFAVLIVPSAITLSPEIWERLAEFAQSGGSLVVSYGGSELDATVRELVGVDYLGDAGPGELLACRVAQPEALGALASFDAPLELPAYALLSPTSATVIATDANGNPLLTLNRVGQGRLVYIAAPLERALSLVDPLVVPKDALCMLSEVYAAAARMAGCEPLVACDVAGIEVALFQGEDSDVLVLVNHDAEEHSANVTLYRLVASIADVRGGEAVEVNSTAFGVSVKASDAVALRIAYRTESKK
ncbi:MAG TPA: beta-galactosidase trimerization domain-containing protein [Coriobacteriia bacterium]|nr:beta-galactosidase trimerization domain-containing protein [Coriobacteriia bacterium]